MPKYTSDYGGNSHSRATIARVDTSHHCRDCGILFYLTKNQLARQKAAVKCPKCGGPGIETKASTTRRFKGPGRKSKLTGIKPYHCTHCDKDFRSEIGLELHIENSH